jgi:hypothetical protein
MEISLVLFNLIQEILFLVLSAGGHEQGSQRLRAGEPATLHTPALFQKR